jgi:Tfp pilus assembly protein PilP
MTYLNKTFNGNRLLKNIFALAIILFLSTVMVGVVGCKKTVETKRVNPQKTVKNNTTVPQQSQDKELDGENISEELGQDISQENKEKEDLLASPGYVYEPGERRDPFIPLVVEKKKEKKNKMVQNAPPLESYDAKEFRVIATAVSIDNEFYALLLAPDKKSYTVTEGTKLGFHMGKIKEINMNEVIVEEYEEDHLNELKLKRVILKLRREEL